MVNKEEIINLANLARINITPAEAESLSSELDSILDYVGQIKNSQVGSVESLPVLRNVMREDIPVNKDREYTEDILNNAPSRDGNYLKVKKIL
ncbi:MAG: aspartyl-tRNA(Asn)/glutamyl-tRNA (Gln) amidotransferase subunit C [Parcubacteria group bacterium Gr01-1014_46]|nr:MAG: aspartyl-tRNA(Asn)/glutamyl-tRNA (Gln) amidotransferase subunit C [Parcubacteria group bacterium Gr01-1014_46]